MEHSSESESGRRPVRQLAPEEYGHTVIIGGEPIPCTTWLLKDEDSLPVKVQARMTEFIAEALAEPNQTDTGQRPPPTDGASPEQGRNET